MLKFSSFFYHSHHPAIASFSSLNSIVSDCVLDGLSRLCISTSKATLSPFDLLCEI